MADYDKEFSGYGFAKNAGYGTAEHLEGLNKLGITPIHRKTFEPIKSMVAGETSFDSLFLLILAAIGLFALVYFWERRSILSHCLL